MHQRIASIGLGLTLALGGSAQAAGQLNVVSWSGYFSPQLLEKFEKESGIRVTVDSYDSNETLLAKLKQGGAGYDVAIPSQQFVPILVKEALLERFDPAAEPYYANLLDNLKKPAWDPEAPTACPSSGAPPAWCWMARATPARPTATRCSTSRRKNCAGGSTCSTR